MADRALLAVGRYDVDVTKTGDGARQRLDTLRADAVVVADENDHAPPRPYFTRPPRYAMRFRLTTKMWPGGGSAGTVAGRQRVGAAGFEPATTRTPSVCATRLRHAPHARFRRERPTRTTLGKSAQQKLAVRKLTSARTCRQCAHGAARASKFPLESGPGASNLYHSDCRALARRPSIPCQYTICRVARADGLSLAETPDARGSGERSRPGSGRRREPRNDEGPGR